MTTKYTEPDLRERLKEEIKASNKGGRAGQWSARKAQLLAQEYKRQGGDYKGSKGKRSKHLDKWTEEHWQTRGGKGKADTGKEMKRYLPERAWDLLSEKQKKETDQQKRKAGKQFVPNTRAARAARAYVDHGDATMLDESQLKRLTRNEVVDLARQYDISGRSKMKKADLARVLSKGFSKANSGMTKDELLKQAEAYGVKQSRRKDTLIHDIVSASQRTG
ncbi:MAG: hypothetical protein GF331_15075 [Chitinivibrionales bacterium]|nr:hypothetical protein [Chitinivibrionales bacterium]